MSDQPFGRRPPALDDDDLEDDLPGNVQALTDLEEIAAELDEEVRLPPVTLEVPGRPGYAVRYDANIDWSFLQAWRKAAKDKDAADGVNLLTFCSLVLADRCEAIIKNGAEVELGGAVITFTSTELRKTIGASRPRDAVRKLYGVDPHVIAAAQALLSAAGYDDEIGQVGVEDPTGRG